MTLEEHIAYWIESADNDLSTAESNFETKHYDWCLFIGHLVLEKSLKALYAQNNNNETPPKIHNLFRLSQLALIKISEETENFLIEVNKFQMEARYPQSKKEFYKLCTEDYALEKFNKIKETYSWLKSQLMY